MKRKIYSLHITDFSDIGGQHFYGHTHRGMGSGDIKL